MPQCQTAFWALWPGYKKTAVSIEFKYHPFQKVSYRIKRVLIQILSGHVLKLILTGIFYGFLNIYASKILSNFKGLKLHLIHDFKQKNTLYIKKQSLSFQNTHYVFKTLGNI